MPDLKDTPEAESVLVDINEFSLSELSTLDGTALGAVLKELKDDALATPSAHNSHHSHSSFSKHGTAMW